MKSIAMKNSETAFLRFNREQEGPKKWELTIGHDLSLFETELEAMTHLVKVNPMPYIQIVVTPHFYWELLIDDVLRASGQAHDETSSIDAATIAHNNLQPLEKTSDYIDQS
jgi:hypothetical protein